MSAVGEFREALEQGNVGLLRKIWAITMPHLPQPKSQFEAEIVMHRARTEANSISFKKRAWSHRWLVERDIPSGLPENLRPSAERVYPVIAEAVGISVSARNEYLKPAALEIEKAMSEAVAEAYVDGNTSPEYVRKRIQEARNRSMKELFGVLKPLS